MNSKIKKGLRLAAAAIFVFALAFNIKLTLDDPFVMLSDEAIASTASNSDSSGVDYSIGYIDDPKPCTITETRHCSVKLCFPGGWCCSVGFDYTINVKGTINSCKYTGGPSGCNPYACKKNGA